MKKIGWLFQTSGQISWVSDGKTARIVAMTPTIIPSNMACLRKTSTVAKAMGKAARNTPIVCVPIIQISAVTCRLGRVPIHYDGQGVADVKPSRKIRR